MYYAELNIPKNHVYLFKPQEMLKTALTGTAIMLYARSTRKEKK